MAVGVRMLLYIYLQYNFVKHVLRTQLLIAQNILSKANTVLRGSSMFVIEYILGESFQKNIFRIKGMKRKSLKRIWICIV